MPDEITNEPASGGTNIETRAVKTPPTPTVAEADESKEVKQSPEQEARTRAYKAEERKNKSQERFWDTCTTVVKIAGWFVGVGIALLGIFYGYKINNISEPIGGVKADLVNVKENQTRIEGRIDTINSDVNGLKDFLIGRPTQPQTE